MEIRKTYLKKNLKKKHPILQEPKELRENVADKSLNVSEASEDRSNSSLQVNDSLVNADTEDGQDCDNKKSDQELWDQMIITGACGFCKLKLPVSYTTMDIRLECAAYPDRGSELYEHMDKNHEDVTENLCEY